MNEAPWLTPKKLKLIYCLLQSHTKIFQKPLIKFESKNTALRLQAQVLFILEAPVIAHTNDSDPSINYVNSSALQLWGRDWKEMVGMPSRLTAPKDQLYDRSAALNQALKKSSVKGYQGIRVNKKGQLFTIHNARVWTVSNEAGKAIGQAATFPSWSPLQTPC